MSESHITILSQPFAPKPLLTSDNVPDQTDRTLLVRGGNIGIGREIVRDYEYIDGLGLRTSVCNIPIAQILLSEGASVY